MANTANKTPLIPHAPPRLLSFVFPVFNEAEVLPLLRQRMFELKERLPCLAEYVFVDDGSNDGSGRFLSEWARRDPSVKVIHFSRNFGHQAAITAGLDYANGDAVILLDADLQDPPELALEMLDLFQSGYDVVYATRSSRFGENYFKRATASAFYWVMRTFIHPDLPRNAGDFRLMSKQVVEALRSIREGQRFIRGLIAWLGFHQTSIHFERLPRAAGETKFSVRKMGAFAIDAILSFSWMPLRLSAIFGFLVCSLGTIMGILTLIRRLVGEDLVPGWPSIVILLCFLGGAILFSLGLLGEYVGRIYEEIKRRPLYVVSRALNVSSELSPERAAVSETLLKNSSKKVSETGESGRCFDGE